MTGGRADEGKIGQGGQPFPNTPGALRAAPFHPRKGSQDMVGHFATFILAGGKGARPGPLTKTRAKSLLPFRGGEWRLIDFAVNNCLRSGLHEFRVLTRDDCIQMALTDAPLWLLNWSRLYRKLGGAPWKESLERPGIHGNRGRGPTEPGKHPS